MRVYEVIFIVEPDTPDDQVEKLILLMKEAAEKENGKVVKVERWGKRRLAYTVKKHWEGFYVLFLLQGTRSAVTELERRFKMTESVIKFLTVRVDTALKKQGKWPLQIEAEEEPKKEKVSVSTDEEPSKEPELEEVKPVVEVEEVKPAAEVEEVKPPVEVEEVKPAVEKGENFESDTGTVEAPSEGQAEAADKEQTGTSEENGTKNSSNPEKSD